MQPSDAPRIELAKARDAIQSMRSATTLEQFEEHWKEFLRRVERSWNKTFHHYGKSPKWSGWSGATEQLRKKDPLLSYLVNARGAEEHTVNEIVGRQPGGIGINPAKGNVLEHMEINMINGNIDIKSDSPLKITFRPARTTLIPVVNRGRTYAIPMSHLGYQIDPNDVVALAEIAAEFYESAVSKAEDFFVK